MKAFGIVMLIAAVFSCPGKVGATEFESQHIMFTLDVPTHTALFTDTGTVNTEPGWNLFRLGHNLKIKSFSIDGKAEDFVAVAIEDTLKLPAELAVNLPEFDTTGQPQLVVFKTKKSGPMEFAITYSGEFYQETDNIRFSNEKVGGEITGTILDKGAYLSSAAIFYPQGTERLAKYRVTSVIPADWEGISDGNIISSEVTFGQKVQTFENPFIADGVTFFAAPFVVKSVNLSGTKVSCYFFPADTSLMDNYLRASADYIQMYNELIGPYAYKQFTVVENFFPTGYGMPAWTLLGQEVVRLPFIIGTSLGHEVLHNWWGNSVFVDYDRGNWCEGATVYGADYRYKLLSSPGAARDYRKDILKQYVSYVDPSNDFPLRDFKSRTSPDTRTIGYNKAMMVYHMIEKIIGTAPFFNTWRLVYDRYKGQQISWEEWIDAFETVSGKDLSYIIPQWIDRAGAPTLDVSVNGVTPADSGTGRVVSLDLKERGDQVYTLTVPLRFTGPQMTYDTSVLLEVPSATYSITVPGTPTSVDIDPDYDLFRRLYPEEVEPVVEAVIGKEAWSFVSYTSDTALLGGFSLFAQNFSGDTSIAMISADQLAASDTSTAPILFDPTALPDYLAGQILIGADSVTIAGTSYPRAGYTFVLSGQNWKGHDKYLVLISSDAGSLPRIGQLVPHYGKYSYLVFQGPKNVGKGQWPVTQSPLKKKLPM
jgi:hypothetical protein